MTKAAVPPKAELERLYQDHGGSIAAIARHVQRPLGTVKHWFHSNGYFPGLKTKEPPPQKLREVYERHSGYVKAMAKELGVADCSVRNWMAKAGLEAKRRYQHSYPKRIDVEIKDGILIAFSDAHWWEREKNPAHQALLATIKTERPSIIVANGDMLDGADISRHDPLLEAETPSLIDELQVVTENMAEIKRAFRGSAYFCWGNHDTRLGRYLLRQAPEVDGIEGTRLPHHLLGWDFCWSVMVNQGRGVTPLFVTHRVRGGQHATWNNLLKAGTHVATGHLHSQKVYPFTDLNGTRYGVDLGCLASSEGPQFAYTEASPLDWRSGFGIFEFQNYRMLPPRLVTVTDWGEVYMQTNKKVA